MGASKLRALFLTCMLFTLISLPPLHACGYCGKPSPHGGGGGSGGGVGGGGGDSPIVNPPPVRVLPPPPCLPGGEPRKTCPIDALKLGLCLDVLGRLVHVGLGNPVENTCCPVLQGLLEVEAALCLCTAVRVKLLNLNVFIPLALSVLAACGLTPSPGFTCPPIS